MNNDMNNVNGKEKVLSKICKNILGKLKKFFGVKRNIIIVALVVLVLVVLFIGIKFLGNKKENFVLNQAYDVYPDEVRELYANIVSVSCNGDIHFDINVDGGKVDVDKIKKQDLLNYMFSYLDKHNLLEDHIDDGVIKSAQNTLFDNKINLLDDIKSYSYGDHVYNYASGKVNRKGAKCQAQDVKYVTHLYGYYLIDDKLSIDVLVGYEKNNVLYTYDNKEMGEYDGDVSKLSKLMEPASYYTITYTRYDKGKYKLSSIEWKHKS